MYDIYINYFREGNSSEPVTTERKMYSIPIATAADEANALTEPIVKVEMGKTGSFEFSMAPGHPYYNAWLQMKTLMRVEYGGETIFRGRVLTIDIAPLTGIKKIHLEGDYAFLLDSIQAATRKDKEEERPEISATAYLENLISVHNAQMDISGNTAYKKIYLGEVPGRYSNTIADMQKVFTESRKYGSGSWQKTSDALEELLKEFGGYFRTRYDESNGLCYLDWLDYCFNANVNEQQPIEVTENLIDINGTTEVDNLFTAFIPIGSNESNDVTIDGYRTDIHGDTNYILVPQVVTYYDSLGRGGELDSGYHHRSDYVNAVRNYGIIYKTQSFSNADTQEKLFDYAMDWMKNNYVGGITSFSVSALDLHHDDEDIPKYMVGDLVRVIYPDSDSYTPGQAATIEKTLTITSITYNLHAPQSNEYTVGVPTAMLNKTYGQAKSAASSTSTGGGGGGGISDITGGGGGGFGNDIQDTRRSVQELDAEAWKYVVDGYYNNQYYKDLKEKDPKAAQRAVNFSEAVVLRTLLDEEDPTGEYSQATKDSIKSIFIDGMNSRITMAGYMPGLMAVKEKDKILEEMNCTKTIVLDGYVGQMTIEDHYNFAQTYQTPVVWTDEMIASYITWKDVNAKPLFQIKANQQGSASQMFQNNLTATWKQVKNGIPSPSDPLGLTTRSYYDSVHEDANTGTVSSLISQVGIDPTNLDMPTIIQNGLEGVAEWLSTKPSSIGEAVAQIMGGDTQGSIGVGKTNGNWTDTINKTIRWTDSGGTEHVIEGGVHAVDYHVDSIGSFSTKFAQIDTLVATKASIQQLNAVSIEVGTLSGKIGEFETLVAGKATLSEVYSSFSSSTNIQMGGFVCTGTGQISTLNVGGNPCKWTVLKCKDWNGVNQAYNILIHS